MKHEYHEDENAKERFEEMATQLFRAPKPDVKIPPRTERAPKKTSKD
jgi:hypothetical protein